MSDELWLPIVGSEGSYEVSNFGKVRSLSRVVPSRPGRTRRTAPRVLSPVNDSDGYCVVKMRINNRGVMRKLHRVVAEAFIPNPEGKPQVNHRDADKKNNHASNLEWVTAKEHGLHSAAMGLRPRGSKNGQSKLKEEQIPVIRARLAAGETGVALAKEYGVSMHAIKCVKHRRQWKHVADTTPSTPCSPPSSSAPSKRSSKPKPNPKRKAA